MKNLNKMFKCGLICCYKTFIMNRVEKNIKSKLFDLYEEQKMLIAKKDTWHKEIGGLTREERVVSMYYFLFYQ